ncbi:asparaginase domain-containing protein [Streptomyces samsunensis]|uniref:asparaginase n=1 Tax=Streptomyces malaysiensis subsp. samsunensis TaxID=459658 RepID=A0A9X2RYU7_STRMQ|nr:asparaginase domain-containing protein [Streptomyces samsunensis]
MAQLARRSGVLITLVAVALGATASLAGAAEPHPRPTPKVAVIGTGGTIAGVSRTKVSFDDYQAGKLPVSRLVGDLRPEVNRIADVTTQQFGNKDSNDYTIPEYRRLTAAVDHALKFNDGVVVTTGTDTMEEFAYWLDLTVRSDKPVVLTGSMRPWTVIGSDAPANLYNAIHLAASGRTTCFGTVVMRGRPDPRRPRGAQVRHPAAERVHQRQQRGARGDRPEPHPRRPRARPGRAVRQTRLEDPVRPRPDGSAGAAEGRHRL